MNDQRKAIFEQRRELMSDADLGETIADMRRQVVDDLVAASVPEKTFPEQWKVAELRDQMLGIFDVDLPLADWAKEEGIDEVMLHERLIQAADERAAKKAVDIGPNVMRQIEKAVLLQTLDHLWREHLVTLEHLRQVIGLRGYGQRDPLNEYKSEAFTLFEHMLAKLREAVTGQLMHVQLASQGEVPPLDGEELPPMEARHFDPNTGENEFALEMAGAGTGNGGGASRPARAAKTKGSASPTATPGDPSSWGKVQRNALCPCGSGKKYKHCHGTLG
jgi:preprotein translocase subunit SecA